MASKAERFVQMKRPRIHLTSLVAEVSDQGQLDFFVGGKFMSELDPDKALELAAWINDVFGESG